MKRNTLFGGLALLAAGTVIGAGAMISSNVMADDDAAAQTNQMTMITFDAQGEPVQCTFSGAELSGLLPELSAIPVDAQVVTVTGEGSLPASELPEGAVLQSGTITVDGAAGLPVLATSAEARNGTDEECQAMHDDALQMVSSVPNGAVVVSATASIKP